MSQKKKILIAHPSREHIEPILGAPEATKYLFSTANTGTECWEKIEAFEPDLILIDLMLPKMHAIEILKKIRAQAKTRKTGVIITSSYAMIQNYHTALKEGADYFLNQPCATSTIFSLFDRFFSGTLLPDAFSGKESIKAASPEGVHCYLPPSPIPSTYLKFWGTRGSTPVAGSDHVHFGGNTCCLEIRHENTLLIIDAGTGIRPLGEFLTHIDKQKIKTIHLFIGHTHWDHIIGFPFFSPLYQPDYEIVIWAPVGFERSTRELFTEMLAYAYFPVRLDEIQAKLTFKELRSQEPVTLGDITVDTHYAYHPGVTLCFKVQIGKQRFGYVTDNEVLLGYHGNPNLIKKEDPALLPYKSLIDFLKNCDFLVHEAQYTPQEYQQKVGWGHSSVSNAAVLMKYAEAKKWLVTHHHPQHTDKDLEIKHLLHQAILKDCGHNCPVEMLYDDYLLPLS